MAKKPIEVSVSMNPNLLQHTLVGLGVGRFREMVNPSYQNECDTWIQSHFLIEKLSEFREIEGVSSSTWFALLYQIPAYLAEDNVDALIHTLEKLSSNDPWEVVGQFPKKKKLVQKYMPQEEFHRYVGFQGYPSKEWSLTLKKYIDAIRDAYDRMYFVRWMNLKTKLTEISSSLQNQFFSSFDWINWWEKRTGLEFPYPRFSVELIDTTITQGTSLLAERDGFYAHADPLEIATVVSHEIATHLLYNSQAISNQTISPLIKQDLERYLRTVEVVSWVLNKEIIQEMGLRWTMERSFDWIGPSKEQIIDVISRDDHYTFWDLMAEAYDKMVLMGPT